MARSKPLQLSLVSGIVICFLISACNDPHQGPADAKYDLGSVDCSETNDICEAVEDIVEPIGCLGGVPAGTVIVDPRQTGLERSDPNDLYWCCNEGSCCTRSNGVKVSSLLPAGDDSWQLLAEQPVCCIGPQSTSLMRVDASGSTNWMRTMCHNSDTSLLGTRLVAAIPFAGGHLGSYRTEDIETSATLTELRFIDQDGGIKWTLSHDDLWNATSISPLAQVAGSKANFILYRGGDAAFLSVSPDGDALIAELPSDNGYIATPVDDIPEGAGAPVLLLKNEVDSFGFTDRVSFSRIHSDGSLDKPIEVDEWAGEYGINWLQIEIIGPGVSGFLLYYGDNRKNVDEIVVLDKDGKRLWSFKGILGSPDWHYGNRLVNRLQTDGNLLIVGNRYLSPTDRNPMWAVLSYDDFKASLTVKGTLEMPFADKQGWTISALSNVDNRWIALGSVREYPDGTDTSPSDTVVAIYDSTFNLIHARKYGNTGAETAVLASHGGSWALAISTFGEGLACLDEIGLQDVSTRLLLFDGVCE